MKRTHTCGELTSKDKDKIVELCGWVHSRRDHGGLIFIDLRDREGITQVVFNPEKNKELHTLAHQLKAEYVISITGEVLTRPPGTENPKLPTGEIEVLTSELKILNPSLTCPFDVSQETGISEELRFTYRYLDLRRPKLQNKLLLRYKVCKIIRDLLDKEGFIEVETPILTKSTPEGARDYLVPSRLSPGRFYALPQSPQLFKQILMISGLDRYFQIAKCFRDEDLRADRQPEFTQLDIEMSFVDEDDIFSLTERLMSEIFKAALGIKIKTPFPKISYKEALGRFGTDKPDIRFGLELVDLSEELRNCQFRIFAEKLKAGGVIKGLNAKGCGDYSRARIDELTSLVKTYGAEGLAYFKIKKDGGTLDSPIKKFFTEERQERIKKKMDGKPGDLLFLVAETPSIAMEALVRLRSHLAKSEGLVKKDEFMFVWITDFPLFKYNEEEKRWETEHHPFTAPVEEDIPHLSTDPASVGSRAYDLVINGVEVGSGSIRIHDPKLQQKIFEVIGMSGKEVESRFGFLVRALSYGAPPHGGIAPGLDRLVALMSKSDTIRDVIAFPKTQRAICPLTEAPSFVTKEQLKELGLKLH